MGAAQDLLASIVDFGEGNKVNYVPHNFQTTQVLYGLPPLPVHGLQYVFAQHNFPQAKLHMSLNTKGVFVNNLNQSGIFEFAILASSLSSSGIAAMQLAPIAWPLSMIDTATNGLSTWIATAVRQVGTPQDRKGAFPGLEIYTFATPRLIISRGTRNTISVGSGAGGGVTGGSGSQAIR